ncbi:hypothetical protein [Streptomyces sp. NPDC127119]|uniref:hypothetical protein n=1 Tax=Streptomyces sp. NPDC127119 TaxID=3345370 RepID=UPI00364400D2
MIPAPRAAGNTTTAVRRPVTSAAGPSANSFWAMYASSAYDADDRWQRARSAGWDPEDVATLGKLLERLTAQQLAGPQPVTG